MKLDTKTIRESFNIKPILTKDSCSLILNEVSKKMCLLKKFKCFHGASSITKQHAQVIFRYWWSTKRSIREKRDRKGLKATFGFYMNFSRNLLAKTYGILDKWRVADGGKIFWKFFEPGFLKRWRGELPKSFVKPWSSRPSRGSWTVWCLERVTRIILPYIFCPLRWLIAKQK